MGPSTEELVLLFGAVAGTVGVLGKPTHENREEQPWYRKINRRGWVVLACVLLGFSANLYKQHREKEKLTNETARAESERTTAEKRQSIAEERQAFLESQVRSLSDSLKTALQRLSGVSDELQLSKKDSASQRIAIGSMSRSLETAHQELAEQSLANLTTQFANSNLKIRDVTVVIPFTKGAHAVADFRGALLPHFSDPKCADLTGVTVIVATHVSDAQFVGEFLEHEVGRTGGELKLLQATPPRLEHLEIDDKYDEDAKAFLTAIGQKSWNRAAYYSDLVVKTSDFSAADLYRHISLKGAAPLAIQVDWPGRIATRTEFDRLKKKYPFIAAKSESEKENIEINIPKSEPFPKSCAVEVQRYFASAYSKALLSFTLDQPQRETIAVKLKAKPPAFEDGTWRLNFESNPQAVFSVSDPSNDSISDYDLEHPIEDQKH